MLDRNKTYGLALEGGGFRGSYQAGAIYALWEKGIKIGAVCGSSSGSMNASFVAMKKIEELKQLWLNFRIADIFEVQNEELEKALELDFKNIKLADLGKGILETTLSGGLNIDPLINLIKLEVDEELVRQSDIDFGLVVYNLDKRCGQELMIKDIPEGLLSDYLMASAYLPIFKRRKLHGVNYLDGGFHNNMPASMMADRGYKDIIQIRTHRKSIIIKPEGDINLYTIKYKKYLGPIMIHDKDKMHENFKAGYNDALELIGF